MKFYILGSIIIFLACFFLFVFNLIHYHSLLKRKKIKPNILLALRFFSITLLLFLLLEPYLSFNSISTNKKLNIFIDNSKSLRYNNIDIDSIAMITNNIGLWASEEDIETSHYIFGDSLREKRVNNFNFNDQFTNFNNLTGKIDKAPNITNIIISDGNSTQDFELDDIDFEYPVNFIGVGSLSNSYILIENIQHLHSIIQGDSLNISFDIVSRLDSRVNSSITILSNEKKIFSDNLLLGEGVSQYHRSYNIPAFNLIDGEFDIQIESISDSENSFHDKSTNRVTLINNEKKILLISGSVNPNTQKIKDIVKLIPNISFNHIYKFKGDWGKEEKEINFNEYDFFIFDNFPIDNKDEKIYNKIKENNNKDQKYIYFEGPSFNVNIFHKIDTTFNLKFSRKLNKNNFISKGRDLPSVSRNFIINKSNFKIIHLEYSDSTVAIGEKLNYLYISIPNLSLLSLKTISGDFNKYISDILYIFMDSGRNIYLHIPKREIISGEQLDFYLDIPRVYNHDKSELIINNLLSEETSVIKTNKLKSNLDGNKYIDKLSNGEHKLYVKIYSKNKSYRSNELTVNVIDDDIERKKLFRNSAVMRHISIKSGGNYYEIENYNNIKSLFSKINTYRNEKIEINIHSLHKFWFLLVITLIIEWFYRKQKGLL